MAGQTPAVRWSRIGAMAFAWLFTAGVAIQIFLAGLALFDTAERWRDHTDFGMSSGSLLLPLLALVLIGSTGREIIGMTVGLVILFLVQVSLPQFDVGAIAALLALVAFVLLGMSAQLGARIRALDVGPSTRARPA